MAQVRMNLTVAERVSNANRLTQDEWIAKARAKHGDKYDYGLVEYTTLYSKVRIKCRTCGSIFDQTPSAHATRGKGCARCAHNRAGDRYRLPLAEWIGRAVAIHGMSYDYSSVEYTNNKTKVSIKCLSCGNIFKQTGEKHLSGRGCPTCSLTSRSEKQRLSQDEWIAKAKAKHGSTYDYGLVKYTGSDTKVKIRCMVCGNVFEQIAYNHAASGHGCPKCSGNVALTLDKWIENAKTIHGCHYDYSHVHYINSATKVKIKCNACGNTFEQTPSGHVNSTFCCPQCAKSRSSEKQRLSQDEWIAKAKAKHGGRYDYSMSVYLGAHVKVKITCLLCGVVFEQEPDNHIYGGRGCPKCKESRGEHLISMVLDSLQVTYEQQRKFPGCRYKRSLPFDFYLPDHNACIEYHGKQHYESIDYFGGEKALKATQRRDRIKAKFCKDNGIHLEVIPHWLDESQVRAIVARIAHIQLSLF